MNPYASEDYNRFKVKGQQKPKQEEDGKIDHPLFEGKKLDMSKDELKAFTKAMEQPEFKTILSEYVQEISDPKNLKEQEQYLRQLEEQGDLPVGTKLIKPIAAFCIKTMAKKLISDINKQYFDQKTFINICMHEDIQKPQKQYTTMPNGKSGYSWQLPYSVSKGRHDQDKDGKLCTTYDVVFHRDIGDFIIMPDFQKFVCDTAVDGVNRVLAEHKEKVSTDYKILKHLKCKGGEPALLTIKVQVDNKLLKNADISKHETKLQKEVTTQADQHRELQQKQEEEEAKMAAEKPLDEVEEEEEEKEDEEPMPTSVVQPKYKIVYAYPVQLQDCWEGPNTLEIEMLDQNPEFKIPNELTITINVPHVESMKLAHLDINESNLVFEYPSLYYLDLNLKYKCDASKGHAKHDKTKKTLTIRVPVVGMTEDSQKVYEENYKIFKEKQQKRMEQIKQIGSTEEDGKEDLKDQKDVQVNEEVFKGEAKTILPQIDVVKGEKEIEDKYNMNEDVDVEKIKKEALEEKEEGNEREQFLKIYKEVEKKEEAQNEKGKEIKFKEDYYEDESESNVKITDLQTNPNGKPLIQEISSNVQNNKEQSTSKQQEKEAKQELLEEKFAWETAQRQDLKYQFIHQKEYVFVNVHMRGYNKLTDVRYAFSENELLIEVKDQQKKVNRLCKTLSKEVDVDQSSIELLVDFIAIKLKKMDKDAQWNDLGYDISEFTLPKKGQMKSNFMTYKKQEENNEKLDTKVEEKVQEKNDKENKQEVIEEKQELLEKIEKLKSKQICYMNLDSSVIFKIY